MNTQIALHCIGFIFQLRDLQLDRFNGLPLLRQHSLKKRKQLFNAGMHLPHMLLQRSNGRTAEQVQYGGWHRLKVLLGSFGHFSMHQSACYIQHAV